MGFVKLNGNAYVISNAIKGNNWTEIWSLIKMIILEEISDGT